MPAASANTRDAEKGIQGYLHCALFYTEMYVLFSLKTWEKFLLLKVGLYYKERLILFSVTPFSSLALHSVEQF